MRWELWKKAHRRRFDFVNAVYRVLIFTCAGLGVGILVGGTARFPFPTYKPLLDLTNGEVWPWGLSILAAGALMSINGHWLNMLGLAVALLWMNIFSAMFVVAYQYPTSGSTAPIPYAGLAMIIVAMMTYKITEHRARKSAASLSQHREE